MLATEHDPITVGHSLVYYSNWRISQSLANDIGIKIASKYLCTLEENFLTRGLIFVLVRKSEISQTEFTEKAFWKEDFSLDIWKNLTEKIIYKAKFLIMKSCRNYNNRRRTYLLTYLLNYCSYLRPSESPVRINYGHLFFPVDCIPLPSL